MMKKSNYLFKLIAMPIIALTFNSCSGINWVKDLIKNDERQSENFLAEQRKSEMTTVSDGSLIIYKPIREIKIDPKFIDLGQPELIREAYNKPGKPILFYETHSVDYLAKNLWTKYNYSKEVVMLHYNKSKNETESRFIFQTNTTKIKEVWDIVPMSIFLALLIVSIYGMLCLSDTKLILQFWLILLSAGLVVDIFIKHDCFTLISIIPLVLISFAVSFSYSILSWLLEFFKKIKIPMPNRKEKDLPHVLSFSLVASIVFLIFAKLSVFYLVWPFLFFMSPYLIFWIIGATKTTRPWTLRKISRRAE